MSALACGAVGDGKTDDWAALQVVSWDTHYPLQPPINLPNSPSYCPKLPRQWLRTAPGSTWSPARHTAALHTARSCCTRPRPRGRQRACQAFLRPGSRFGRFSVLHQGAVDMHAVVFLPKGYYRLSRPLVMRAAGGALVGVGTTKPAARLLLSFCCTPLSV